MRLRTTAPPIAFLMLKPKRLCGSWLARKNTVKWEFERRLPVRYTASNSPRRTNRAARGNSRPSGLLGCEPMASLLAAGGKHLAAADRLHSNSKSVCLRAPPFPRLICPLWQNNPPSSSYSFFPLLVIRPARTPHFAESLAHPTHIVIRLRRQPSTGRTRSRFRISKCSRPPRKSSRKWRGWLIRPGKLLHPWLGLPMHLIA